MSPRWTRGKAAKLLHQDSDNTTTDAESNKHNSPLTLRQPLSPVALNTIQRASVLQADDTTTDNHAAASRELSFETPIKVGVPERAGNGIGAGVNTDLNSATPRNDRSVQNSQTRKQHESIRISGHNISREHATENESSLDETHLPANKTKIDIDHGCPRDANLATATVNSPYSSLEATKNVAGECEPKSLLADVLGRFNKDSWKLTGVKPLLQSNTTQPDSFHTAIVDPADVPLPATPGIVTSNETPLSALSAVKTRPISQSFDRPQSIVMSAPHTPNAMDFKTRAPRSSSASQSTAYDALEDAVVHGHTSTPPRSTAASSPRLEPQSNPVMPVSPARSPSPIMEIADLGIEFIPTFDELADALERIDTAVSDPPSTPSITKVVKEKQTPVVRATKASMARISLAHGPKDRAQMPALGRPRQSGIGMTPSASRTVSGASAISDASDATTAEKKEVVIPHSKPRPMSMMFPAPPPPVKSTKAVTKSTFQLPGEAVAAKLKAAKEARLAEEAERNKKQPFKARPVPATMHKPAAVRQTSTSKARESIIGLKMNGVENVAPAYRSRPSSVMLLSRPNVAQNASARSSTSVTPVPNARARPASSLSNQAFQQQQSQQHTRDISTTSSSSAQSSASFASSTSTAPPVTGTTKGKEVFSRFAQAKDVAEREKREREEAAKRARAEAAERSRALSREWAEKQRRRVEADKAAAKVAV